MAESPSTKPKRKSSTIPYSVVGVMLLFIVAFLPIAVASVTEDVTDESEPVYDIHPNLDDGESRADVHVQLIGLNEWDGTASIRVSAHQTCGRTCTWGDRFLFVSTYGDTSGHGLARPASEIVALPAGTRDVTAVIQLPVYGDPIRYPFDRYRLAMGIVVDRVAPDGSVSTLSATEAREYANITLQARVPRMTMSSPRHLDPASVQNDADVEQYATVELLVFQRPAYLRVLTGLLVILVTAAAAYAVFMRPLDQLIINSGALVLGVWGIRSILLGTSVPGLTAVDLSLIVVILFLLVTITVRTLWLLEQDSRLSVFHRLRRHKPPSEPATESEKKDASPPDNVPEVTARV